MTFNGVSTSLFFPLLVISSIPFPSFLRLSVVGVCVCAFRVVFVACVSVWCRCGWGCVCGDMCVCGRSGDGRRKTGEDVRPHRHDAFFGGGRPRAPNTSKSSKSLCMHVPCDENACENHGFTSTVTRSSLEIIGFQ